MPNKLIFCTDIHLNFLRNNRIQEFCETVAETAKDSVGVVITGDISEAPYLLDHLELLEKHLASKVPVFFVLGNHDYYKSSLKGVQELVTTVKHTNMTYLQDKVIHLTEQTALVGVDGWYDGGYSNFFRSPHHMCDYQFIEELVCDNIPSKRLKELQKTAKFFADKLGVSMEQAATERKFVIVATHIPPFKENSTHQGKISDEVWLPHFSSKATGDVIRKVARKFPDNNFIGLCGHTHDNAVSKPMNNVICYTSCAEYRHPEASIKEIIIS